MQKPLPPRVISDTGSEYRMTVLFNAERNVANQILQKFGSVGRALQSFDRNHNGVVRPLAGGARRRDTAVASLPPLS